MRAIGVERERIQPLRQLFLQEANHQNRYEAVHHRGWSDAYLLMAGDAEAGYGSVKGQDSIPARDTVFELFVLPPFRRQASALCKALIEASGATYIECQSNDPLLTAMLFEHARNIRSDVMLFEAGTPGHLSVPGATVRPRRDGDVIFDHTVEPVGDYVLELDGEIAATGGFLLHYNPPFADLFMEVHPQHRRKGLGSLLVQEVVKACYLSGRVPAARCDLKNVASQATLTRAGLRTAGFMLVGDVAR